MKSISVYPGIIRGKIDPPSSKSVLQRLFLGAALAHGRSSVRFHSLSSDARSMLKLLPGLGAEVDVGESEVHISGNFQVKDHEFCCGESGLCIRMLAPVLAHSKNVVEIRAEGSLANRPQDFMQAGFEQLNVRFSSKKGFPPLLIQGPIEGGTVCIDAGFSSQFLSGLLFSLPLCKNDSEVFLFDLKSKPYIDLTLDVLGAFGIKIDRKTELRYLVPGRQRFKPGNFVAEADWSAAVNWIIAALIAGRIELRGLNYPSLQADSHLISLLAEQGIEYRWDDSSFFIQQQSIEGFAIDCTHMPDLIVPLVPLALNARSESRIKGVHRLVHKESNRLQALLDEFSKLGAEFTVLHDELIVVPSRLNGGVVQSHNDHRIAMALAIAALNATERVQILEPDCVAKSYPGFWSDFSLAGAIIIREEK